MHDGSCATSLLAGCPNLNVCEPMSHRTGLVLLGEVGRVKHIIVECNDVLGRSAQFLYQNRTYFLLFFF